MLSTLNVMKSLHAAKNRIKRYKSYKNVDKQEFSSPKKYHGGQRSRMRLV